jgi:hypothetical protein
MLLLQSILVGSGGLCDAFGGHRAGSHAAMHRLAGPAAATGHNLPHGLGCSGMSRPGCGDTGLPGAAPCALASCVPTPAFIAVSALVSDSPASARTTWGAKAPLHSVPSAPATPPPRT